jgi:AMP nucleosidase
MTPQGVKTTESDNVVTTNFVDLHIQIGIDALKEIKNEGQSVKHLKWE